jgi:hypothetical protein
MVTINVLLLAEQPFRSIGYRCADRRLAVVERILRSPNGEKIAEHGCRH